MTDFQTDIPAHREHARVTAREMYVRYRREFPKEPDEWSELVDYILSEGGTVVVATLVIKQGQQELSRWLTGQPLEIQEALLVTYFKQGRSYIDRFKPRLAANPNATLVPGEGCRVFNQRASFKAALRVK